ncbi:MAG: methylmalonyl Co-A mutase-associated GTPase MeaB [Pseudomonadota bacterium]|nr:methylmalonyl Co-A mutase-associated GTPase MeaB [Pseudomonadota bacterium]
MRGKLTSAELVEHAVRGYVPAIARLLSRAEAGGKDAREGLDQMYRHTGKAHIVGITGVPGSGKSTLVSKLAQAVRATGRKVGIIAIDPSSPFSGGSILGDRIRMSDLVSDPGIFIRSMATRGALGGLARGTLDAVDVLDGAGYDMVMIETVGVGQDEVEVVRASHTTVVVSAPGLGDEIQAIKAGVLEIADIHVVSKCDRPDADKTIADLKTMMAMGVFLTKTPSWSVPVLATSSAKDQGVIELAQAIDAHRAALETSGDIAMRVRHIAERRMLKAADEILRSNFERHRGGRINALTDRIISRDLTPHGAATELLHEIHLETNREQFNSVETES